MNLSNYSYRPFPAYEKSLLSFDSVTRTATYTDGSTFTLRRAGEDREDDPQQKTSGVSNLSTEEKDALRRRLNQGQGGLSLQEWDDFLADLVDLGLITNDERYHADGLVTDLPDWAGTKIMPVHSIYTPKYANIRNAWTGDPIKWLNELDMHYLKKELSYGGPGAGLSLSSQRSALVRVSEIIKELFK